MKTLHLGSYCISVAVVFVCLDAWLLSGLLRLCRCEASSLAGIVKRGRCLSALLLKYAGGAQPPGRPVFCKKLVAVVASYLAPLHAFLL